MIRVYTGYDERESVGWHAFTQSLLKTSADYVLMDPLSGEQGDGSNTFTYERFSIPDLCDWAGWALFVDGSDMLLRSDISELQKYTKDSKFAVRVVKHEYKTKHPKKYLGTEMEAENSDYPKKNWSSVILWNCGFRAHFNARQEIREAIARGDGKYLHRFSWLRDEEIGDLPIEWNWLADEYGENPEAKLLHWTAGIPGFYEYRNAPHAEEWRAAVRSLNRGMG